MLILDALAHVEGLHVSARTSSFNFKGKNEELSVIAAKVHVRSILEGSVRKEGTRVRITVQVVNARTATTSGRRRSSAI